MITSSKKGHTCFKKPTDKACLSMYEFLSAPDININLSGLFMGSFYGEGDCYLSITR